jgi:hypothetical protein
MIFLDCWDLNKTSILAFTLHTVNINYYSFRKARYLAWLLWVPINGLSQMFPFEAKYNTIVVLHGTN